MEPVPANRPMLQTKTSQHKAEATWKIQNMMYDHRGSGTINPTIQIISCYILLQSFKNSQDVMLITVFATCFTSKYILISLFIISIEYMWVSFE